MTIRNKPKRRTTITPEMLEILAKGIKRRRHKVAVVRAMLGITVHEPGTGAPIARLNPVPGTDKFTVRWWSGFRRRWMPAEALGRHRADTRGGRTLPLGERRVLDRARVIGGLPPPARVLPPERQPASKKSQSRA